jgi:hypothetical protein
MAIAKSISTIKLDPMGARRIDETYYIGNQSDLVGSQIINIHPVVALEKGLSLINAVSIYDQGGNLMSKWTEAKNINLGSSQLWTKLNGVTSTNALRVLTILGDWYQYFNKFDDAGTFGHDPNQINSQGDGSKKVVTGIGSAAITLATDAIFAEDYDVWGPFALYPLHGRHIYIAPTGEYYVSMAIKYDGSDEPCALYGKSIDGGLTWTWTQLNDGNALRQTDVTFAVDKYGDIHFTWQEVVDANVWNIRYRKLTTSTGALGAIAYVNFDVTKHNYASCIQAHIDGEKMCVCWCGDGYGDSATNADICLRVRNFDGSWEAVEPITTNGGAGADFYYNGCSLDYDSAGYRHVLAYTENFDVSETNLLYLRETADGFDAPVQINSDGADADHMEHYSKILINSRDEAIVAYTIGAFGDSNPLYIKRIVGGVVGTRTLVEAGGAGIGGTEAQIQVDSANRVVIAYMSGGNSYGYRVLSPTFTVIGTRYEIYKVAAGNTLSFFHIPWGIPPLMNGINPNIIQQGVIMLAATIKDASPEKVDITILFKGDCVLGAPTLPSGMEKYTYNIRGAINRSKFNSGFNPSI